MALKRSAKIWITIISIPIVLFIVALIAAKIYFTSDRLKALIVPALEDATHRAVSVDDISLSVFPTLAVSIDHVKISNASGSAFSKADLLSLDNLKLKVKIFKLLANKLEISYVILNHPKIYLEVTENGSKNYSEKETGSKGGVVENKENAMGELLLSNLEINDGEIETVNKKFNSHMLIAGLHQTAAAEVKPGENALEVEGSTSIDKFSYGTMSSWFLHDQSLTASLHLRYDILKDILLFRDVNMTLKELPLTVAGTISNLSGETSMLDLTITTPGAQMTQLLSLIPPDFLKKTQGLTSSGDIKFSMTIKGASSETMNPGTTGSFTLTKGTIQYASLPKSITNITLAGSFEKQGASIGQKGIGKFSLDQLTATLGRNDLGGKLTLINFDDPTLTASFNGMLNLDEVKEYYPLEQGTELKGIMKGNVSLSGKAKAPETMKANGQIEFETVTIETAGSPRPIRNLKGTIAFNNQLIESKQLSMTIGESDLSLTFALRNYLAIAMQDAAKSAGKPSATLTLNSKLLRTADLMPEPKPQPAETEKKSTPTAKGGLLPGFDIDANVNIEKLTTEKFTFNNAHGAMSVANGIVTLKNFNVNAFDGTIQTKGTLDLRDAKKSPFNFDLDIKGVESHSLLPNFTSFGNYLYGKFSTTTNLQGDLNDTLGLEKQSLLGNGAVQIFDGKLLGLPLTNKLAEVTNLTELREVNFKNWANAFSISNGRFTVKDLKVNAGPTDFLVGGSQGLDGSLDYNMTVKLPESVSDRLNLQGAAAELLQFIKDKDGRINLTFQVTGDASSPVLRLDTQAQQDMAKKALEQKGNEAKQKLEDDLKKKAEDALKKLFKRP